MRGWAFRLGKQHRALRHHQAHFEGLYHKNPKARHGKNKQKRNDCRQVAVGIALDYRGLALAHEVFEGNMPRPKPWNSILMLVASRLRHEMGTMWGSKRYLDMNWFKEKLATEGPRWPNKLFPSPSGQGKNEKKNNSHLNAHKQKCEKF